MSAFTKADYELINLGVCIKNQADRLEIEHDGVPLEGVVVRIAEATIAARGEAIRLLTAGVVAEEPEWEYVPGWIADNGRARISQGVIAPSYVAEFIAEGGEVVRRRVSRFERVTADMAPVKQEGEPTDGPAGD